MFFWDRIVPLKTKCTSCRRHYKTRNKTPWDPQLINKLLLKQDEKIQWPDSKLINMMKTSIEHMLRWHLENWEYDTCYFSNITYTCLILSLQKGVSESMNCGFLLRDNKVVEFYEHFWNINSNTKKYIYWIVLTDT